METTPERGQRAESEETRTAGRTPGLARALLLTVASAIVPGTAHLSRGRKGVGFMLFSLFLIAAAVAVLVLTRPRQQLLQLAVDPRWLLGIIIGAAVFALAWAANIVWSYVVTRPKGLGRGAKIVAGATVTALCLLACAPLVAAANYAQVQRDMVTDIFPDTVVSGPPGDDEDRLALRDRLNILLLGGDADPSRPGVRTDVMIVASVDPTTGRTVLLSIPRNLQDAPMPFPALQERFPNGFPNFLFGLWRYGVQHPDLVPGHSPPGSQRPGAHLLTETIEKILGLPVHYYALVDLDGFKMLIDALGGVWIDVQEPIPYGTQGQFTVEAGYRELTGREALWYARSRLGTSDYDRMQRQRCMLGAIANQADPLTVLRNFRQLASAAKRLMSTNIPRGLLPEMVDVAPRVKNATITNIQFVPPLIDTGDPDYAKIRRITDRVISQPSPSPSPTPERSGRTGAPRPQPTPRIEGSPSYMPPAGQPGDARRGGPPRDDGAPGAPGQRGPGDERPGPRERPGDERPGEGRRGSRTPTTGPQGGPVSITAACPRITEPGG